MRIYIASALPNLAIAREWAVSLRGAGHEVTSTWHDDDSNTEARELSTLRIEKRTIAEVCLAQVYDSEAMLWLHGNAAGRVGAAVEVGAGLSTLCTTVYAFSLDGQPPPSVFGELCESVCDLADLLARLT